MVSIPYARSKRTVLVIFPAFLHLLSPVLHPAAKPISMRWPKVVSLNVVQVSSLSGTHMPMPSNGLGGFDAPVSLLYFVWHPAQYWNIELAAGGHSRVWKNTIITLEILPLFWQPLSFALQEPSKLLLAINDTGSDACPKCYPNQQTIRPLALPGPGISLRLRTRLMLVSFISVLIAVGFCIRGYGVNVWWLEKGQGQEDCEIIQTVPILNVIQVSKAY